jgi:hypothetical protein
MKKELKGKDKKTHATYKNNHVSILHSSYDASELYEYIKNGHLRMVPVYWNDELS